YAGIANEYLYDNEYLKIGFGTISDGYLKTSPLQIIVDKNKIIQKIITTSYGEPKNKSYLDTVKILRKYKKIIKVGNKFELTNTFLLQYFDLAYKLYEHKDLPGLSMTFIEEIDVK